MPSDEAHPVTLSDGLGETTLPAERPETVTALRAADAVPGAERRDAVAAVLRSDPRSLFAWAALGDAARDDVEAYAAYRVGYHRGLDALRKAGWRGSGLVRFAHPGNRGFLRCLDGLRTAAAAVGEDDEVDRCTVFLRQLDPAWTPGGFGRDGA
ncbi:MAG: DUF3151 family protein [Actinomycetota bacterium]|nr:DUF3151 family protein [Actinomycetota bacterium]